ncbi:MAG: polyphosphate kinase 2 family protein [Hyphomicrobiaceae bacterium]
MSKRLGEHDYNEELKRLQTKLARIQQAYLTSEYSAVVVFEGWDAAGKGGTIRRISSALDPRSFKVWPIGAPREYYLQRHYLLRFMERLPPQGSISLFDRSWYGRVLVERVEELIPKSRWQSAYGEIQSFEKMIIDDGVRLVKIFLHITQDEQLERFEDRLRNPLKRWKLSYEDFRNRKRWNDYAQAVDDMFARTSTEIAPWTAIPANNKKYSRIKAMRTITEILGAGLDLDPRPLPDEVLAEATKLFGIPPSLKSQLTGRTE